MEHIVNIFHYNTAYMNLPSMIVLELFEMKKILKEANLAKKHMSPEDLAERWDLNIKTLMNWRWLGCGPDFLKINGKILYREREVEEFEEQRLSKSTTSHQHELRALKLI